ncbi:MAG: hypothetical protein ACK4ZW_08620 [Blastomonas sp.]
MTLARFRIRRDTAANWTSVNPVLQLGEPGLETDTRRVKYGDGSTAWASLAYSGESFTASITALAGLTPAADSLPYFTSSSAAALATLTSYARTLLDDADASTARGTLGLGTMATQAASSVAITGGTITGLTNLQASGAARISGLPVYANDTAAAAGGLVTGDLYRQSDGVDGFYLKVKV